MNAPIWLQVITASALTFAVTMFVILITRRVREQRVEEDGVEMHVSPYYRRPSLLTPAERQFYLRLYQAIGNEVLICPKVRLADVVDVRGDAIEWQASWNRIVAKHVDFLLVTADDQQPLLAIELDDGSHDRPDRKARDEWLDRALYAVGLPVLRIRVRRDYDPAALRREVEQKLILTH